MTRHPPLLLHQRACPLFYLQYLYILHLQSTLPPRLLHTSLLCPVPLHTSYLTCSSTTTTWTTTSDEQHVKPQNHTVIVSKLQRSIVTFSSIEDRKKEEKIREQKLFWPKIFICAIFYAYSISGCPVTQLPRYPVIQLSNSKHDTYSMSMVVRRGTP